MKLVKYLIKLFDFSIRRCPKGSVTDDQFCPQGSYCEVGTPLPTLCPAGKYGLNAGLKTEAECTDCVAGYFCPEGTRGL